MAWKLGYTFAMSATLRAIPVTVSEDGTIQLSEPLNLSGPVSGMLTLAVENGDETDEVSEDWSNELHKRSQEIDEGKVELVEGDEFLKRLRAV